MPFNKWEGYATGMLEVLELNRGKIITNPVWTTPSFLEGRITWRELLPGGVLGPIQTHTFPTL